MAPRHFSGPPLTSGSTSVFDDMLRNNWERFDVLAGKPTQTSDRPPAPAPAVDAKPRSAVVRELDDRFGDGWRYQIVDHHRDGDEVTVLCKLVVDASQSQKMQFGSARISGVAGQASVAGSSDGITFELGASPQNGHEVDEDAAYQQAVEAALVKCAALL